MGKKYENGRERGNKMRDHEIKDALKRKVKRKIDSQWGKTLKTKWGNRFDGNNHIDT